VWPLALDHFHRAESTHDYQYPTIAVTSTDNATRRPRPWGSMSCAERHNDGVETVEQELRVVGGHSTHLQ
jgi:hypothetical protein